MLRRRLVALVHQRLQQFAACVADAACQEQVIEDQQVGLEQPAHLLSLLGRVAEGVLAERAVGLHVAQVVALKRGLVGHGVMGKPTVWRPLHRTMRLHTGMVGMCQQRL